MMFETDCLNLKLDVTISDEFDHAPLGALFSDAKFHLSFNFVAASVVLCPRICNKITHNLAALGTGHVNRNHSMWLTNLPDVVQCLVADDLDDPVKNKLT